MLLQIGEWLAVNGEGIIGSQPWTIYGSGKLNSLRGGSNINDYDKNAVRYTQNNGALYSWFVTWPEDGKLILPQADSFNPTLISALGGKGTLKFTKEGENLIVELPDNQFGNYVWGLKLTKEE